MKSTIRLLFLLLLTGLLRCYNFHQIFGPDHLFFVDADCYSRMSRVEQVLAHPWQIPRHHSFENYPDGTTPHTTVPMDYAIALLAVVLRPFSSCALDLAGALISPILGVLLAAFLWLWFGRARLPYRDPAVLLFACSPILVHGTVLGRPDHQSLLMLLLAVALGADWILAQRESCPWAIVWGLAWGMALWTSLYEPGMLLALVLILRLALRPKRQLAPDALRGFATLGAVLLLYLLVEHWRIEAPGPALLHYFPAWEKTIGELTSIRPFSAIFLGWLGLGAVTAPALLLVATRRERRAIPALIILIAVFALTCWQARWGYFLGLIFVMTLPLQLAAAPRPWLAWALFLVSLWPVLNEWDRDLMPENPVRANETLAENELLLDVARHIGGRGVSPILAPWWMSPALAYWTGEPAVAGSSHESLPGIVDTAEFYLTDDPETARPILRKRQVREVVAYDPDRTLETASRLLGKPAPPGAMARVLYERPHSAPPFLRLEYANGGVNVFGAEP